MKKRLLCLLLVLVLALPVVLTACSNKDDTEADVETNTGAKTITMRIITEQKVCNSDEELEKYLADECGGDETDEKYVEMKARKEAYDAVEAEFSKRTKQDKINVDIIFYTEDEYYDMLEVTMADYALEQLEAGMAKRALDYYIDEYMTAFPDQYSEAAITRSFYNLFPEYKKYQGADADEEVFAEDVYVENDLGIQELVYPKADANQLDIVYISGEEMYNKYIENGWIVALDEYLGTTGGKLNDYITGTLMNGVKVDGQTFAIPNNVQMGEYTYMLLDKTLVDRYKYTYDSFTSLVDCEYFLEDIMHSEPDTLPIDASFKECMDLFVWYWNIEVEEDEFGSYKYNINTQNDFSVLGCVYGDPAKTGRGKIELGFNNLLNDSKYVDILLTLKGYEYNGLYRQDKETRKGAAVSFVNSTYAIKKEALENDGVYCDPETGKEYYAYVAKYPQADNTALYGNMFAVSANSKNVEACMKVITLLNTNSQMKNLLQYGIEGVNYIINEETGMLERLNRDYLMDTTKTGNCYISHPEEGLPANYWDDAKKQSNETLINPLLGFDFNARLAEYGSQLDVAQLAILATCNEDTWADLMASADYENFVLNVEAAASLLNRDIANVGEDSLRLYKIANKDYSTATGNGGEPDMTGESPYTIYYKWLVEMKYLPDTVK